MMTPALNAEKASPTLNMHDQFGVGRKEHSINTGAPMVQRTMQVEITNPSMRQAARQTVAYRHEPDRLSARRTRVVARSGNQQVRNGVDKNLPEALAWGEVGQADEEAQQMVGGLGKTVLVSAVVAGLAYMFLKS